MRNTLSNGKRSIAVTGNGAKSPLIKPASSFAPCNISASKINTIEGGIIWPNVPLLLVHF